MKLKPPPQADPDTHRGRIVSRINYFVVRGREPLLVLSGFPKALLLGLLGNHLRTGGQIKKRFRAGERHGEEGRGTEKWVSHPRDSFLALDRWVEAQENTIKGERTD